ncbi:regulatory protein RecX [Arenimonas fontis]|uniref:Regulatory protein RecX n=1 Tax=Arenimonas fontis TaxID=2608255 RepID=A0A5B2ZCF6_9GAMM|nr:regulatory protein RecX [Arenimonas fontis]KAA2285667.1 regulatory protein RecX [Arenimonas fontis]
MGVAGGRASRGGNDPYQRGLGLLVRREYSRRDLARRLVARGFDSPEAEAAVDRLAGQGYQDDRRFSEAFARDRAAAGYGPVRIRAELSRHGLGEDDITAALAACEADWAGRARELVARRVRLGELADPGRCRKWVEFLLRRGFDQDQAWGAVRAVAAEEGVTPPGTEGVG